MGYIDVMGFIRAHIDPQMVEPEEALPGRETPVLDPIPKHLVFDLPLDEEPEGSEVIYFAMGCYWGAEKIFFNTPGVLNTSVGFLGGYTPNPTYRETCTGKTGHTETVKVVFDPDQISVNDLLKIFWEHHNPTTANRQGNDIGTQYRSAIFTTTDEQLKLAERSREVFQAELDKQDLGQITTQIQPAGQYYLAEEEHQQYLIKVPNGYDCHVRTGVACPI